MTTSVRLQQEELLDLGYGSQEDVTRNLTEMQRINDLLGGTRALTRHLYPRILRAARSGLPVTILDIGTGGAGLPVQLTAWAQKRGIPMRVTGLDRSTRCLRAASECSASTPGVNLLRSDALCLPLPPEAVDFVISSLVLHHFDPPALVDLLGQAREVARCGLVLSDLERGSLPALAFRAITPLFAREHLTRQDGLTSVRRAYTAAELLEIAHCAGLFGAKIYRHFPWRLTLVVDR